MSHSCGSRRSPKDLRWDPKAVGLEHLPLLGCGKEPIQKGPGWEKPQRGWQLPKETLGVEERRNPLNPRSQSYPQPATPRPWWSLLCAHHKHPLLAQVLAAMLGSAQTCHILESHVNPEGCVARSWVAGAVETTLWPVSRGLSSPQEGPLLEEGPMGLTRPHPRGVRGLGDSFPANVE